MKLTAAACLLFGVGVGLGACASGPRIAETRMVQAPPLPATCTLQLISVDITQVSFNQTWEVLGYVTLLDQTDPSAPANHDLVRPRACAMGGTAIALALSALGGTGSTTASGGVMYMVLHPKPPLANGSVVF